MGFVVGGTTGLLYGLDKIYGIQYVLRVEKKVLTTDRQIRKLSRERINVRKLRATQQRTNWLRDDERVDASGARCSRQKTTNATINDCQCHIIKGPMSDV